MIAKNQVPVSVGSTVSAGKQFGRAKLTIFFLSPSRSVLCALLVGGLLLAVGCREVDESQAKVAVSSVADEASNPVIGSRETFVNSAVNIDDAQNVATDPVATQVSEIQVSNEQEFAQQDELTVEQRDRILFKRTSQAGVAFLLNQGQAKDGSFSKQLSPAVTALCTSALLEHKIPVADPRIQKSLTFLEGQVKSDGGIYAVGSNLRNYETSVSLMCFDRANVDGKYDQTIQKAIAFLKGIQWDEGENHTLESTFYGGQGYGSHKRPDASNTSYFMDALRAADEDPKSEAFQKAATFMARCQNLSTPSNTAEWASNVTAEDRGGFIYTAVGEGESKAESDIEGGLRSYGSMTYAGLKSFLYAGVDKDDVRVKAAMDWIGRHYDLTTNPGLGQQGLFYYYHVFAKTLSASGQDQIVDSAKVAHDWRVDLTAQLAKLQSQDGSWTNPADRWFEGDPNLVTAYAMLALSYCDVEPASPSTK